MHFEYGEKEISYLKSKDTLGKVNAETILSAGVSDLQALGISFRKAEYITDFALLHAATEYFQL